MYVLLRPAGNRGNTPLLTLLPPHRCCRRTPRVKSHLRNVYLTLTGALVLATAGVLADIKFHLGGAASFLVTLFGVLWLSATPPTKTNQVRQPTP